ncbi:homoserine kinase [Cenarchaeum symbiosum A]|uniref:Homoserine kinase n=1 Tax=Cenarchaeum symbiosum (strain A) TaxID=414004 RepID=A0RYT8_CENSY|nr:homoserine kinase [Cenarchaeum symbiosum A]
MPTDPRKNTAGVVVRAMAKEFGVRGGFDIIIEKGVPAGFGMGSSAASAAAAAAAFDRLMGLGLDQVSLVRLAGKGEKASAGSIHYDNVAASVMGGFVIVREGPIVTRIPPPKRLAICVAIPDMKVPPSKTKVSRGVLPARVGIRESVGNISNAAAMAAGFAAGDPAAIGGAAIDCIAEPARKRLIPGFDRVKSGALRAGALGATISGAGPSVVAFLDGTSRLKKVGAAMSKGFQSAGLGCSIVGCRPCGGVRARRLR